MLISTKEVAYFHEIDNIYMKQFIIGHIIIISDVS